jgi:hypothetical protein
MRGSEHSKVAEVNCLVNYGRVDRERGRRQKKRQGRGRASHLKGIGGEREHDRRERRGGRGGGKGGGGGGQWEQRVWGKVVQVGKMVTW